MRFSIRSLLILVAIFAGSTAAALFVLNCVGPIRPIEVVEKVLPGMPRAEVRELLGNPTNPSSTDSWVYSRTLNPGWLVIYFGEDERVQYVDHETVFR